MVKLPTLPDPDSVLSVFDKASNAIDRGLSFIDKVADKIDRFVPSSKETTTITESPEQPPTGTACLPCTKGHLLTVEGSLAEAVRFARERGVRDPEVQERLDIALQEININERKDLHPSEVARLDPEAKEIAHWILPNLRELRHAIENIAGADDMEQASAMAADLRRELSKKMLECEPCEKLKTLKEFIDKRKGR